MSLAPAIQRLSSVAPLVRLEYALRTSLRSFSQKHFERVSQLGNNAEKDLRQKIYLKDEKNNILGIKSWAESKLLAQKHHMNLIEDKPESQKHKYKVFKLVSTHFLSRMGTEETSDRPASETETKSLVKEPKHLVFSTKLSENDLMTKINQTKRWLSKGHHINIQVMNHTNDTKAVEEVFTKFESELKNFVKFNQKKIKSDKSIKFVIVPNANISDQLKASGGEDDRSDDIDDQTLDPNKLLSDEFERKIEKELENKRHENEK